MKKCAWIMIHARDSMKTKRVSKIFQFYLAAASLLYAVVRCIARLPLHNSLFRLACQWIERVKMIYFVTFSSMLWAEWVSTLQFFFLSYFYNLIELNSIKILLARYTSKNIVQLAAELSCVFWEAWKKIEFDVFGVDWSSPKKSTRQNGENEHNIWDSLSHSIISRIHNMSTSHAKPLVMISRTG